MNLIKPLPDREDALYDAILSEISAGSLKGGDRLKVSELAKRHGLSTSPVREVLRRMQGEGFVDIHPNRGASVRKADAHTIQNIFEILQLLEPYFVSWFAEFAQPELLDEMEQIQAQIREMKTPDLAKFRKLDSEFHGVIARHHYNSVAADHWIKLRRALNVHAARLRINTQRHAAILEEHDDLLAALRAGDVKRADMVIRKHVGGSFVQMTQQMRALGF